MRPCQESEEAPEVFHGYVEKAYRLLFAYEDKYSAEPSLQTILPGGVVEAMKQLQPTQGKGLFTYPYPQSILAGKAEPFLETPFVWAREDGSFAVVQIWTTNLKDKFKDPYQTWSSNPDEKLFLPQAVSEFQRVLAKLFEVELEAGELPLLYCLRQTSNYNKVYAGTGALLLKFLQDNSEIRKAMNVLDFTEKLVAEDTFLAEYTDKEGKTCSVPFTMDPGIKYALYKKVASTTMACVTPWDQFTKDRELLMEAPCASAAERVIDMNSSFRTTA